MILTSYADNFEDALLWRALGHVQDGFYIDAGAADPERGSLTCALYNQGWRGINIEPAHTLLRRLRAARPADTCLGVALAAAAGSAPVPFYEVAGSGRSTLDAERAGALRAASQAVLLREVELTTLDAVCAAHAPQAIHLLHLDVGSADGQAEAALLAGLDLQRWRPWVIVLKRADTAPLAALLAARYQLAQADGVNHFYVAGERAADHGLAAKLALPAQPADGFVLCEGHPRAWPLEELRARLAASHAATAAAEAERLHQSALAANARADLADARVAAAEARADTAEAIADARHTIDDLLVRVRDADKRAEETAQWANNHARDADLRAEHSEQQLAEARLQAGTLEQRVNEQAQRAGQMEQRAGELASELAHMTARASGAESQLPGLHARAAQAETTLQATYASLSWRITRPLRWGKFQLLRSVRYARRQPGRVRAFAVRAGKGVLRRSMRYVIARPKLSFFLRRNAARLPFMVPLLRSLKMRLEASQNVQATAAAVPSAPPPSAPSQIPDAARQVLADLRRRASHS
ncbi:hypothetical protein ASC94_06745 [Massilia sp. Root418]|jgi:FkbM family methyltransferase|uniref:FkbM family methyltransferase n=1 Tax=Massilia sp. Root418 TaxID=1736532 RepID=UPI0006F46137|nr:FkbM family methyltransferase [Massilia sp. Root418]KQW96539.1 hypothetical protein ASC94_06745 [Massilia sp. Root418]